MDGGVFFCFQQDQAKHRGDGGFAMAACDADDLLKMSGNHAQQNGALNGRKALCQGGGHFRVCRLDGGAVYNGIRPFDLAGLLADIYLDAKAF